MQSVSTKRQESHRVYLQQFTPHDHRHSVYDTKNAVGAANAANAKTSSASTSFSGITKSLESFKEQQEEPVVAVNTTSAAVRLTLAATTRDVTELLRRKFGLPQNANCADSNAAAADGYGSGVSSSSTKNSTDSSNNDSSSRHGGDTFNNSGTKAAGVVLPAPVKDSSFMSPLDRINAHLALRRQKSSNALTAVSRDDSTTTSVSTVVSTAAAEIVNSSNTMTSMTTSTTTTTNQAPPVCKKYDPHKDDTLVIVASCFVPRGYVHFEHETRSRFHSSSRSVPANNNTATHSSQSVHGNTNNGGTMTGSEAFNLFHSLSPDDRPLLVKDAMYQKILSIQEEAMSWCGGGQGGPGGSVSVEDDEASSKSPARTRIQKPPVIRFFFMPCHNGGVSNATIEMEGYCTDHEDEDEENVLSCDACSDCDNHNDMVQDTTATFQQSISSLQPWNQSCGIQNGNNALHFLSKEQQCLVKERRLIATLTSLEASSGTAFVSGYLLKKSVYNGGNVWKRVHCMLPTHDQFWYVTRAKHGGGSGGNDHGDDAKAMARDGNIMTSRCVGRHHVIDLNGTFLMEAVETQSPVSGVPFAFQLMTRDGDVHTFRANSRHAYSRWMDCISRNIVLCQENSYFEVAEDMVRSALMAKG